MLSIFEVLKGLPILKCKAKTGTDIYFKHVYDAQRIRWSRGSVLAFSTQVRGFKLSDFFSGEKILSAPSFVGEVKPSVPCRRFAASKRSLNGVEVRHFGKITGQHSRPQLPLPPLGSLTSWQSNGKLLLRTCPGCSVPEPYQSPN